MAAYETSLILATGIPALVFALFTFSFNESKGMYKHFFSLVSMLFLVGTLTTGYTLAKENSLDGVAEAFAGLGYSTQMIMNAWLLIFGIGLLAFIYSIALKYIKTQKDSSMIVDKDKSVSDVV